MPTTEITRTNKNYTVGWICVLQTELAACQAMLGRIGQHNVVLACLPSGTTATATATATRDLLRSFPKVRFGLMVGVGGGTPSNPSDDPRREICLGDVIVSNPEGIYGGDGKFIQTGSLNKPPASNPAMQQDFSRRIPEDDQLFQADYDHIDGGKGCKSCDEERLVAGLMDNFPCLVIRGISVYAAATAAAYAKELLGVIPPVQVDKTPTATDALKAKTVLSKYRSSRRK
ncbi:purine and uridine phosphorylase [Elaphomyces granulatus]